MRDLLSGDDLFAEIVMLKSQKKTIIIVEGPDDVNALDPHVHAEECYLIPGYGKESVVHAIRLSDERGMKAILAILDRDWVGICDSPIGSPNVVYTDLYDLDATIFMAGSTCSRVITNFCDKSKLSRHLSRIGILDPLDLAIRPAFTVGMLRLISKTRNMGISVRGLPISEILDLDGGTPDVQRLVVIAIARSVSATFQADTTTMTNNLAHDIQEVIDGTGYDIQYCSGHDLIRALSTVMRKRWGSNIGADTLARTLRAALSCRDFINTSLYQDADDWAVENGTAIWNCRNFV